MADREHPACQPRQPRRQDEHDDLVAINVIAQRPGAGRVAFAGPYRGYGLIVIIEHGGGWTSLVTGLSQLDCWAGEQLVTGGSLGRAGPGSPLLTLELRRQGNPVNPLDFIRN